MVPPNPGANPRAVVHIAGTPRSALRYDLVWKHVPRVKCTTFPLYNKNRRGTYDHNLFTFTTFLPPLPWVAVIGASVQGIVLHFLHMCRKREGGGGAQRNAGRGHSDAQVVPA